MAKSKKVRKRNGKSNIYEDPGPDISLLSRPSATSVKGLRDVLKAFQEGTPEVNHLLSNECEIIYECRVCKSLYRSFLNFITHKRIYCQQQYTSGSPKASHFFNDTLDEDETVVVHNERVTRQNNTVVNSTVETDSALPSSSKPKAPPRKNLTEILGMLSLKASNCDGLQRLVNLDGFAELGNDPSVPGFKGRLPRQHLLQLESMESTDIAIRQTVTLGPDGKILPNKEAVNVSENEDDEAVAQSPVARSMPHDEKETDLQCAKCNRLFSSRKTYTHHMNSVHVPTRISFVCPCCRSKFANSWSVHRHLKSVHNKTNDQLRKLRDQIQRVVRLKSADAETTPNKKPTTKPLSPKEEAEQKTYLKRCSEMEVFEKEYKKCSGCSRKFDRVAAFSYHVLNCSKRNAALKWGTPPPVVSAPVRPNSSLRGVPLLVADKQKEPIRLSTSYTETNSESVSSSSSEHGDQNVARGTLNPRERHNSDKRSDQVTSKRIEIQLRRNYNKVATVPLQTETMCVSSPTVDDNANQSSISRVDYCKMQSDSPLCPLDVNLPMLVTNVEEEVEEVDTKCDSDADLANNPNMPVLTVEVPDARQRSASNDVSYASSLQHASKSDLLVISSGLRMEEINNSTDDSHMAAELQNLHSRPNCTLRVNSTSPIADLPDSILDPKVNAVSTSNADNTFPVKLNDISEITSNKSIEFKPSQRNLRLRPEKPSVSIQLPTQTIEQPTTIPSLIKEEPCVGRSPDKANSAGIQITPVVHGNLIRNGKGRFLAARTGDVRITVDANAAANESSTRKPSPRSILPKPSPLVGLTSSKEDDGKSDNGINKMRLRLSKIRRCGNVSKSPKISLRAPKRLMTLTKVECISRDSTEGANAAIGRSLHTTEKVISALQIAVNTNTTKSERASQSPASTSSLLIDEAFNCEPVIQHWGDIVQNADCLPVGNLFANLNFHGVTLTKVDKRKKEEASTLHKSILECILTNESEELPITKSESVLPDKKCDSIMITAANTQKPLVVKRASVMEWNGFEEQHVTSLCGEARKTKRFKRYDGREIPMASVSQTNDVGREEKIEDMENTPTLAIPAKVVEDISPPTMNLPIAMPKPLLDVPMQLEVLLPETVVDEIFPAANVPTAMCEPVLDIHMPLEVLLPETENDSGTSLKTEIVAAPIVGDISITPTDEDKPDVLVNIARSKEVVDEDIWKVIFEEEEESSRSSSTVPVLKKEVEMNDNEIISFSLNLNTLHDETIPTEATAAMVDSNDFNGESDSENIVESLATEELSAELEMDEMRILMKKDRRLSSVEEMSHVQPVTETELRSASAMASFACSSCDIEQPAVTPSSSTENLLPRTRPVRNKSKVKDDDFIYDMSDKCINPAKGEEDLILNKHKPSTRIGRNSEPRVEPAIAIMNPQVVLYRTDENNCVGPGGYPKQSSSLTIKPLPPVEEQSNNNSSVYNTSTRKSVRVSTKQ